MIETQQGVSRGDGGGKGGRVLPRRVQFCGDVHGATSAMADLWTGQLLLFGGWATEMWQGFFRWGGVGVMGRFCLAAWHDSAAIGSDAQQCVPRRTGNVPLWMEKRPSFGDWATKKRQGASS